MEEVEANPRKVRLVLEGFRPGVVAAQKLEAALRDGCAILPIADGLLFEPEEDAFAMDLAGGDPVRREAEHLRLDPEVELALEVGGHRLDAGESHLGPDLTELSNENDLRQFVGKAVFRFVRARVEGVLSPRKVSRSLCRSRGELLELGRADRLSLDGKVLLDGLNGSEDLLVGVTLERDFHFGDRSKCAEGLAGRGLEDVPVRSHRDLELPPFLGKRKGAHNLREVAVARGADEEPELLVAFLVALGSEPGTLAFARGVRLVGRRARELLARAARALHDHLGEVARRSFEKPQARRGALAFGMPVREVDPRELLNMPAPARESDGHRLRALLLLALVPVAASFEVEAVASHERAAPRFWHTNQRGISSTWIPTAR